MGKILETSGMTGAVSKAGLVIGNGAKTGIGQAAPNGAGVDFAIEGKAYHRADSATNAPLTALAAGVAAQAAGTTCLYLICYDVAGAVTSVKGEEFATSAATVAQGGVQYPGVPDDVCPIGAVKIVTVGVTFTPGTTALDASGITETYIDFIGGIPTRPELS